MQLKGKIPMLRRLSITITVTATFWLLCSSLTLAAKKKPIQPDKFPPSPLEIIIPDPLLPRKPTENQPLTNVERQKLALALDELNQQATRKQQAGDNVGAFEIWNRELRLRRFLGSLAEVQALSRVGAIAWSENDGQEILYINQRLQVIQKQAQSQKTADLQLLSALGQAYRQMRSLKPGLEVYNLVLATVRQQGDVAAVVESLKTIGELHMVWFDYPSAAATYEELLSLASSKGDRVNEVAYLQQLAYIYEQAKQYNKSMNVRTKLADVYQKENNLSELPALKQAIGSDYESLARENPSLLREAFKNYQEAYTTAWQLQQYVRAGEALRSLIALYRSQGQIEEALQASQILVQTEERAVNFYGLMNAYDQIGLIHLERKDYPQALTAFQKALEIARQLKYDETYFTQQIEKLSGQSSN